MAKKISGSVGKGVAGTSLPVTIAQLRQTGVTTRGATQAASGAPVTNPNDRIGLARFLKFAASEIRSYSAVRMGVDLD